MSHNFGNNHSLLAGHNVGLKILVWNCRGAARESFRHVLTDLVHHHKPWIVIILEPRISGEIANKVIKSLRMPCSYRVEANGFSGSIWILWNNDFVDLELNSAGNQVINEIVSINGLQKWLISAVYASPHESLRTCLWEALREASCTLQLPWLVTGDFNQVAHPNDKQGGIGGISKKMIQFEKWQNDCKLLDLGFVGPRFTWSDSWDSGQRIMERLDRAYASTEWNFLFPNTCVHHLPRNNWKADAGNIREALNDITSKLQSWNNTTFGNIHANKRRLLARIKGIQRSLQNNHNSSLLRLEKTLRNEYKKVLAQEELFWFQKLRKEWIFSGDRNTRFYHLSTVIRRRKNAIYSLKDEDGHWIQDASKLRDMTFNFFKNLYSASEQAPRLFSLANFNSIHHLDLIVLGQPIEDEEIKSALFQIDANKAPGPGGLSAGFFQKCWSTTKGLLCKMVKEAFDTGTMPQGVNHTLIHLIPKTKNPESIKQFGPISLINVMAKLISKVMVNRLRPLLQDLISPFQSRFVPGWSTSENIILTQEVIHTLKKKQGRTGMMTIKLDLEKAYDKLSWAFIKDTLQQLHLPDNWVNPIMSSLETASIRLMWNDNPTPHFLPSRGIRQGDPLSPYLFILCLERLSQLIIREVNDNNWKPVRICQLGTPIYHLFFANDLLLFAEASTTQLANILNILASFCKESGQSINAAKSSIFFSRNTNPDFANLLCKTSGFQLSDDLGTYLGVPILHKRVCQGTYKHILTKMQAKLAGWKQKVLSFVGRVTLSKVVLVALPSYTMQVTALPSQTCKEIDKIQRNFIWGSTTEQRRMHWLAWETICQPKSDGGLGLRMAKSTNDAMLAKLGWKILNEPYLFWVKVLKEKYFSENMLDYEGKVSDSKVCKDIIKGRDVLKQGIKWVLCNGRIVKFWIDLWVGEESLVNRALQNIPEEILHLTVAHFVHENGDWNWSLFQNLLPQSTLMQISNLKCYPSDSRDDFISWKHDTKGSFSVSTVVVYNQNIHHENAVKWEVLWKIPCPQRIITFVWQAAHQRVASRYDLSKRGMSIDTSCDYCDAIREDTDHILRLCPYARQVWECLLPRPLRTDFFGMDWSAWININIQSTESCFGAIWKCVFAAALWEVWRLRNEKNFKGSLRKPLHVTVN